MTKRIEEMKLLKFGLGNAKIGKGIHTFSLPSGWTCPGAHECLARANRLTGKVTDGKEQKYRCYATSMESRFSGLRAMVHYNLDTLRECGGATEAMTDLILASLPRAAKIVRVHVGGDFFSQAYFEAWLEVARQKPAVRFYAYTKSINYWVHNLGRIPANFRLTASRGGRYDALIEQYGLKDVRVVMSLEEAAVLGLELDHDDSHAYDGEKPFALLIHGAQAKQSQAGKAVRALAGIGSYGKGGHSE